MCLISSLPTAWSTRNATGHRTPVQARRTPLRHKEHRYKLGVLRYGTKNTGTNSMYSATAQRTPVQARCTPLQHKEHRYMLDVLRYGTKNNGTSSVYSATAQRTPVQARCTPLRHKEHRYKLGVLRYGTKNTGTSSVFFAKNYTSFPTCSLSMFIFIPPIPAAISQVQSSLIKKKTLARCWQSQSCQKPVTFTITEHTHHLNTSF